MRQLRYSVAASLDGYIAGPQGEFDWIVVDPEIDFGAIYDAFGGLVMGRRSYEVFRATGGAPDRSIPVYVYSRTLPEGTREGITFARDAVSHVRTLKEQPGKPLWLWGGAELFRQLAEAKLVDGVEVAVIPVVLGAGIHLMAAPGHKLTLQLKSHRLYKATGTMMLNYEVRS